MERWLIIPDLHLDATTPEHPAYKLVKKFAKDFQPDGVLFLGDVLDLDYIAVFNKHNLETLSIKTFTKDYDLWNRELDFWQSVSKKWIIREGNHEERIARLLRAAPVFRGSIEIEDRCDYAGRGIHYAKVLDKPTKLGYCYFIHGWYTNMYHAKKHVTTMGGNIVYGHTHDVQSYSLKALAQDDELCGWSMGCLCDKQPSWMKGRPTKYMHAFGVFYLLPTKFFTLYTTRIIESKFVWDGRLYK